ncbi:MAG: immune inhibitor A [Anaerolineae bacterium]|nr:immune inhibitor A [Anaerolineae bacterium]
MMSKRVLAAALVASLMLWGAAGSAQEETTRDPDQLARELLGWEAEVAIPPPSPVYQAGDKAQFWVSKAGADAPQQITAQLAGVSSWLYVWVEEGLTFERAAVQQVTGQMDALLRILRIRENQGGIRIVPETSAEFENQNYLPLSDVDNDPHLYVLFARDLNTTRNAIYNPADALPAEWVAGGYTNQHEMITINTSATPGLALHDDAYISIILRQYYVMLGLQNNPQQADWLREALGGYMLMQLQQRALSAENIQPFFASPETSITALNSGASVMAGQLFLNYIQQRFGGTVFRELFRQEGTGMSALTRVLERNQISDMVTGEAVTAQDVFADFVMANIINAPVGDGRFYYAGLEGAQNLAASALSARDQFDFQAQEIGVNQYGTNYLVFSTTEAEKQFRLFFNGIGNVPRLALPGDLDNHFYWSGNGINRHTWMTRSFDLSLAAAPQLTFDAWYALSDGWNYGYVTVSKDGGQTWQVMRTEGSSDKNPYAVGYGPGYTGISNPVAPKPFPYLGVGLDTDGLTITSIEANGPIQNTSAQIGDTFAGFDGTAWEGQVNLLAFLSNYEPGDTVNFYMKRGDTFYDLAVELGTHPTRTFPIEPIWTGQSVDLSAYAGEQILVRFDYVSTSEYGDDGFAVDNIAIEEIGYRDDAEAGIQGWTLNGWQQLTNQVSQKYLVQYALLRPDAPNQNEVGRLIGPRSRETAGSWDFRLREGEFLVVAISGLNDDTPYPAYYSLGAQTINPPATNSS